jgi:hypothetical protein
VKAPREVHVYLNGELKWRTAKPKEEVISQMRRDFSASLLRECEISAPRGGESYLKMRFTVPRA